MPLTLSKRMDIVEQKLAGLEVLPERMTALESQFVQLRAEMRAEFSATRKELREEIRAGDKETLKQMRILHEDLVSRIAMIQEGLNVRRPRKH